MKLDHSSIKDEKVGKSVSLYSEMLLEFTMRSSLFYNVEWIPELLLFFPVVLPAHLGSYDDKIRYVDKGKTVHLIINIGYDDWIIENYKIKKYLIYNAFLGGIKKNKAKNYNR